MDSNVTRRELSVQWDDVQGAYEYTLRVYRKLYPLDDANDEEAVYRTIPGDREWADRISNHYKINLPDQPKD